MLSTIFQQLTLGGRDAAWDPVFLLCGQNVIKKPAGLQFGVRVFCVRGFGRYYIVTKHSPSYLTGPSNWGNTLHFVLITFFALPISLTDLFCNTVYCMCQTFKIFCMEFVWCAVDKWPLDVSVQSKCIWAVCWIHVYSGVFALSVFNVCFCSMHSMFRRWHS